MKSQVVEEVDKQQVEWFARCSTPLQRLEVAEEAFWLLLGEEGEEEHIQKAFPTMVPTLSMGQDQHPTCRRSTVMRH